MGSTPDLHLSLYGDRHLAAQIYQQLLAAMQEERLGVGDVLPPTRELAQRLGVSRGTVTAAYDRLAKDGYLSARVGSGTVVAPGPLATGRTSRSTGPQGFDHSPIGTFSTRRSCCRGTTPRSTFGPGCPTPTGSPTRPGAGSALST